MTSTRLSTNASYFTKDGLDSIILALNHIMGTPVYVDRTHFYLVYMLVSGQSV